MSGWRTDRLSRPDVWVRCGRCADVHGPFLTMLRPAACATCGSADVVNLTPAEIENRRSKA